MAQVKLTKMELRDRQYKLKQLQKYLPTLQLKKAMLQTEVNHAAHEIKGLKRIYHEKIKACESFQALLTDPEADVIALAAEVEKVEKKFENIAGAEIPFFEKVMFRSLDYSLFETPLWVDSALEKIRDLVIAKEKIEVVKEKKWILEKELREVSIRVNLFEKILIPRTQRHIKKIKVFLGDQELASVAQAKVAKSKIEKRKAKEAIA
ncbi:MAG: V-type ATP synthase subunit D [Simkaniaceae bacterium]|nr:V-type ATP synthase subunit D [Simkaniaceae bacterium]